MLFHSVGIVGNCRAIVYEHSDDVNKASNPCALHISVISIFKASTYPTSIICMKCTNKVWNVVCAFSSLPYIIIVQDSSMSSAYHDGTYSV